jgi:hypothetical protein
VAGFFAAGFGDDPVATSSARRRTGGHPVAQSTQRALELGDLAERDIEIALRRHSEHRIHPLHFALHRTAQPHLRVDPRAIRRANSGDSAIWA